MTIRSALASALFIESCALACGAGSDVWMDARFGSVAWSLSLPKGFEGVGVAGGLEGFWVLGNQVLENSPGSGSGVALLEVKDNGDLGHREVLDEQGRTRGADVSFIEGMGCGVVGTVRALGSDTTDLYIAWTDRNGRKIWEKAIGGRGNEEGSSLETWGTGIIVAGNTTSFGEGGTDIWIICLTLDGEISWKKTLGGPGLEGYYDDGPIVHRGADGRFLVASASDWKGNKREPAFVVVYCMDPAGELIWKREIERQSSISEVPIGVQWGGNQKGLVLVGVLRRSGKNNAVFFRCITDEGLAGEQKQFQAPGLMVRGSLAASEIGEYLVAFQRRRAVEGAEGDVPVVLGLDVQGQKKWEIEVNDKDKGDMVVCDMVATRSTGGCILVYKNIDQRKSHVVKLRAPAQ